MFNKLEGKNFINQESRAVLPQCLKSLSNNEKEEYIRNKVSGELKQNIAIDYYIKRKCQIDIAIDKNICVKTLYNKMKMIKKELEE